MVKSVDPDATTWSKKKPDGAVLSIVSDVHKEGMEGETQAVNEGKYREKIPSLAAVNLKGEETFPNRTGEENNISTQIIVKSWSQTYRGSMN